MFGGGSVGNGGGSGLFSGTGGAGSVTGSSTTGANGKKNVEFDFFFSNLIFTYVVQLGLLVLSTVLKKLGHVFFFIFKKILLTNVVLCLWQE